MKIRTSSLISLAVICALLHTSSTIASPNGQHNLRPSFGRFSHVKLLPGQKAISTLPTWKGTFTDFTGAAVNFTMVGSNPTSNATTTVPVYIIPVRLVYGSDTGHKVLDPETQLVSNGLTVIQNIKASPLFDTTTEYIQGGTDLGKTQYTDAFQRGNFWSLVGQNSKYHVLLGEPQELPELTISVLKGQGSYDKKSGIGTIDYASFDSQILNYARKNSNVITTGVLPIFVTYDVHIPSGDGYTYFGGYHSDYGTLCIQNNERCLFIHSYAYATYVDHVGQFAQDISALSHEIAEWMDNPFFGTNKTNCSNQSQLEVGDPLDNNPKFGTFQKTLNNFTYNLQSLAFLGYFGATPNGSVNGWLSFQGPTDNLSVCSTILFDPNGAAGTYPAAINDQGYVTGQYWDNFDNGHGFLRKPDGSILPFDAPDAGAIGDGMGGTYPQGINKSRTIAGYYIDKEESAHSFVRSAAGIITEFDVPGEATTIAYGINAGGLVVGRFFDTQTSTGHGFLRTPDGAIKTLDVPGGAYTSAYAINDVGQIVGVYFLSDGQTSYAFLRAPDGSFETLGLQGKPVPNSLKINSSGVIAGSFIDSNNFMHGFIRGTDGIVTPFEIPEATFTFTRGLNDNNKIVGQYRDDHGDHVFLLDPGIKLTTFDTPGFHGNIAWGINSNDQIVGTNGHGFLRNRAGGAY